MPLHLLRSVLWSQTKCEIGSKITYRKDLQQRASTAALNPHFLLGRIQELRKGQERSREGENQNKNEEEKDIVM
ncbi:hypothetical protein QVD17_30821 [Tagetes erecta]|uniref:Uncharacterized protein n=1 Tax=Tagetes erecta TaxID=13708 RepID=A0AAD8NNN2_TARER|nr:hypothetical protein QVD17_30821 [Tagetes erecta]